MKITYRLGDVCDNLPFRTLANTVRCIETDDDADPFKVARADAEYLGLEYKGLIKVEVFNPKSGTWINLLED